MVAPRARGVGARAEELRARPLPGGQLRPLLHEAAVFTDLAPDPVDEVTEGGLLALEQFLGDRLHAACLVEDSRGVGLRVGQEVLGERPAEGLAGALLLDIPGLEGLGRLLGRPARGVVLGEERTRLVLGDVGQLGQKPRTLVVRESPEGLDRLRFAPLLRLAIAGRLGRHLGVLGLDGGLAEPT